MFERELKYFIENQDRLVREYEGKTLVLRGEEVVSAHNDAMDAYVTAIEKYEPGTFMIQPCLQGADAYTVTITSHGLLPAA
jgi:hypothetical protein